jgi:hypothetical protein
MWKCRCWMGCIESVHWIARICRCTRTSEDQFGLCWYVCLHGDIGLHGYVGESKCILVRDGRLNVRHIYTG